MCSLSLYKCIQQQTLKMIRRLEYLSYKERLRDLGLLHLEKRLRGGLTSVHKYLKGGYPEDGPGSSWFGHGHELKHREVPPDHQEEFYL